MDKAKKIELKTPDRIWMASKDIFEWASAQWVLLTGAIVLIFVGVLTLSVYLHYQKKFEAEAQYHYSKVKSLYEQSTVGAEAERVKTKEDLQKELDVLAKDYSKSRANIFAGFIRAKQFVEAGKKTEALNELKVVADRLPRDHQDMGLYTLGTAYEDNAQWSDSLKAFDEISKMEKSPYRSLALLGKARAERELKKFSDAQKTYELFLEKFGQSTEANMVRGLLAEVKVLQGKSTP